MNIRSFVSGSSVVLAGWLGATFLNEVPSQRYPKLDKSTSASALMSEKEKALAVSEMKSQDAPVSYSHCAGALFSLNAWLKNR